MENLKEEFAKWLYKNAPASYRHYLGNSVQTIIARLEEIQNFFPEIDFFNSYANNYSKLSNAIVNQLKIKERSKKPEFLKYDKFHSNGIPKAVMGSNNYIKFLQELQNNPVQINYWIFQGNPKIYNLTDALEADAVKTWTVSAHRDKIKIGDKIILWLTGPQSGCYALAKVTSKVALMKEDDEEMQFYHAPTEQIENYRVAIEMEHNFYDKPILWETIKNKPEFKDFKGGNQGTNFSATKDQYDFIAAYKNTYTSGVYAKVKQLLDQEKLNDFLTLIRDFVKNNNIDANDERISCNVRADKNALVFIIGKRYCLRIRKRNETTEFSFISNEKTNLGSETFSSNNGTIEAYWNTMENIGDYKNKIREAFTIELKRNHKSPYRKTLNQDFMDDVFSSNSKSLKIILANITWNSNNWTKPSDDRSGHAWVGGDNIPHESWNFDVDNPRNNSDQIFGFAKFTNAPNVTNESNLIIFYSQGKIVGFYGNAEVLKEEIILNDKESYNLIGNKKLSTVLNHKIDNIKEKGYLEDKARVGQIGFTYLDNNQTAIQIVEEAIQLNPEQQEILMNIKNWILTFSNTKKSTNSNIMKSNNRIAPVNQILYGPPGTGKTHKLKNEYFSKYTITENSISPEAHFEEMVSQLTWWQVIALALFEIGTNKVNDILENRWVAKKALLSESKNIRATIWGTLQMHTVTESTTVKYTQRQTPFIFDKTEDKKWVLLENELQEQAPETLEALNAVNNFQPNPNKEIKHYVFTTFHQSFSYEDFIEGIKPVMEEGQDNVSYKIENGIFKELCQRAQNDPSNRYAIFIDEINRGNISQIFGELITLLEHDKRIGAPNEIKVKLPYSKKEFGVPMNVDIIGTMNTADRSVEALDTALRRRFTFIEMMPDEKVFNSLHFNDSHPRKECMLKINQRVEVLLDRNHTLGHSYFIKDNFKNSFENEIIPLLQEFFYNDFGKIGLVLGKGFVREKAITTKNDKSIFADFETKNEIDINKSYELIPFNEINFDLAIQTLLG